MDKFKVNIYTQTSFHGPTRRDGMAGFQCEFITKKGTAVVCPEAIDERFFWQWDTTEAELTIRALINAFSLLTKPCNVTVFTSCPQVRAALSQNWPDKWAGNDWKTTNGQEVKHAELWQTLREDMKDHDVHITEDEHNAYTEWFNSEIARRTHDIRTVPVTGTLDITQDRTITLT
jgi:ribonuclease HI